MRELQEWNATEGSKLSQSLMEQLIGYPIETEKQFLKLEAFESKNERNKLVSIFMVILILRLQTSQSVYLFPFFPSFQLFSLCKNM